MKYKYNIKNLDCANCAREIEESLNKNKDFQNVVVNFNTSKLSYESLKEFSLEHSIDNNAVKTDTDKVLLVLAFIFDINFEESFDILVNTDNFDFYLSMVEVALDSEKLWKKVREICFDKINRGLENE